MNDPALLRLIRASADAALRSDSASVLARLADLGWDELHRAEPALAVGELFEAHGKSIDSAPLLDVVVATALHLGIPTDRAVVHPTLSGWRSPPGRMVGGSVAIDGLLLAGAERGMDCLVPYELSGGRLGIVQAPLGALEQRPVAGLDESLGLIAVRGTVEAADQPAEVAWPEICAGARRALSHELVALSELMLFEACAYVTNRRQFGRPIASFQSVRHRLTEVYVAVMAARSVIEAAWQPEGLEACDAAKALAGRAALLAGKHCLQVTGGIGFTWEYGLHRCIRRAHLVDGLYGRSAELQEQIGATLLERRVVPILCPIA